MVCMCDKGGFLDDGSKLRNIEFSIITSSSPFFLEGDEPFE
jgi:hypothetical protein